MSDAVTTLRHIALDAREFHAAALVDGCDAAAALSLIDAIATKAEAQAAIPRSAGFLVQAILAQGTVCLDVIDAAESCLGQVLADRDGALAIRAKLRSMMDEHAPDGGEEITVDCSDLETEIWERAADLVMLIDARFGRPAA